MDNFENKNIKSVHTLSEDMGIAIRENKDGFVKQIIHDQERKEYEKQKRALYTKRNRFYLLIGIALFVLSATAISYVFFSKEIQNFFFTTRNNTLIFHETTKIIDISNENKDGINLLLRQNVNDNVRRAGLLEGVYFRKDGKILDFHSFLASLNSTFLPSLSVFNKNFLVGIMNFDQNEGRDLDFIDRDISNVVENVEPNPTINDENSNISEANSNLSGVINNFIIFSESDFFVDGTLDFKDVETKQEAKDLLSYLLDLISFDEHKIQVFGIYPAEQPNVNNPKLAENRKNKGVDLLMEVLNEKYTEEEISKLVVETGTRSVALEEVFNSTKLSKMTDLERVSNIDLNNGIKYKIESKIPTPEIENTENPTNVNGENITTLLENQAREKNPIVSNFKDQTNLFILFKVTSFGESFEQIREWEDKMFLDLHGFFGYDISLFTSYLLSKDFEDGFVQNKNTRILYDDTGKIVMMYLYIDDNFVVITNTEQAIREATLRVNSSKIKK